MWFTGCRRALATRLILQSQLDLEPIRALPGERPLVDVRVADRGLERVVEGRPSYSLDERAGERGSTASARSVQGPAPSGKAATNEFREGTRGAVEAQSSNESSIELIWL